MKNVLVFPCGSEIGLEIHRSLEYSKEFRVYGGSSVDDHGRFVYENYISNIPFVEDNGFVDTLNKIIEKNDIDFIFPAHDSVVLKFSQNKNRIKATIITSPLETCEICRSKKKTYRFLSQAIKTPLVFDLCDSPKFPLFSKPDIGQGSKGATLVNSIEEAKMILKKDPSVFFLEYLPGKEYTVDCFTNKNGELLFAQGRERVRISNGISVNSKPVDSPVFFEIAEKLNETMEFRGVWFFQLKEDKDEKLTLLEVAPRVAGTMDLCRMQGVNLPLLSLYDFMGVDVSIFLNNFQIEIDRALHSRYKTNIVYEKVYVDFDDTLIIDNKVNTVLIGFLYQCLNNAKKIILITKHEKDIYKSLEFYKISKDIFNKIILVSKGKNKSDFIEKNSVFIDDSYSERKAVHGKNNLAVFSASEIDCLLEKNREI